LIHPDPSSNPASYPVSSDSAGHDEGLPVKERIEEFPDILPTTVLDNPGNSSIGIAMDDPIENLEIYRMSTKKHPPSCDPMTNVYPCGSLEFIGCSGSKKYYAESIIRVSYLP